MIEINNFDSALIEKRQDKFVTYLRHTLQILPCSILLLDNSKILLAYFAVAGLDVLNKLDRLPHTKQAIIDWIYMHQITKKISDDEIGVCGFRGSSTLLTDSNKNIQTNDFDCSHVTMTFSALNTLVTLEDDLEKINKKAILDSLKLLQLSDGSFTATFDGSENDVRFLYSASCISYILNDWSAINIEKATNYLLSCLTYEGAFGQNPGSEAHGGSTFCAVASLSLMNQLDSLSEQQAARLKEWCLNRQTTGFNGRINKPWDTCYSFWIGSTLKILEVLKYSSYKENINYVFETYHDIIGGFAKWPNCNPDPLHTFMGLCGLSLVNYPNLQPIHSSLVISSKAFDHLKSLHCKWNSDKCEN